MNDRAEEPADDSRKPKRVFLSYAWEDENYKLWVKRLAIRLRVDGVEARLDAWHLRGNDNLADFMNREVRRADWVLVICSPGYQKNVRATEDGERVAGSGWEMRLLSSAVLIENENKVLAVLGRGGWKNGAPDGIRGQNRYDLSDEAIFEANYRLLLREITGTNEQAPPLGKLPADLEANPPAPLHGPHVAGAAKHRHKPSASTVPTDIKVPSAPRTLDALRETALVLLSIGAVGAAVVSALQPRVDPRAMSLMYTIVNACCLGVALLRREAPSEYRLQIASGVAALTIQGLSFLIPPGIGGILAQPAQTLFVVAFGCWTIAFLRRGFGMSLWAMVFVTIAVATLAEHWNGSQFGGFFLALTTLLEGVTAWTAVEAWRRSQAPGLRWAVAGMTVYLLGSLLRSYSGISQRGLGPLAMVPGISATWTLLLNLAVWMVAMSTGGDHHTGASRLSRRE